MRKRRLYLAILLFIAAAASFAGSQSPSPRAISAGVSSQRALIEQYCTGCHSQALKTAGISLEGLDYNNVGRTADVWEKALRKLRTGQMPPPRLPHPDAAAVSGFINWLEAALDRASKANPNPGRPAVRRLNRAEYSNAIRDLLAVDIKPGLSLPVDDSGYGFDNIGDVLSLSPALFEKYMSAARRVSRLAVGELTVKPVEERFRPGSGGGFRSRGERVSDDLPF